MEKEKRSEPSSFWRFFIKSGKLVPLLVAAAIGIGLLLIGTIGENDRNNGNMPTQSENSDSVADANASGTSPISEYEAQLERKIADLCSSVAGVGEVTVSVYINEVFDYVDASSADSGYVTLVAPRISGIGIVCDGGDRSEVKKELTMLISTAFSVGTNKIYITGT